MTQSAEVNGVTADKVYHRDNDACKELMADMMLHLLDESKIPDKIDWGDAGVMYACRMRLGQVYNKMFKIDEEYKVSSVED